MKKTIKQLTINESKWGMGSLYKDGSYCALGFACKSFGASDEEMDDHGLPEELSDAPAWMFWEVDPKDSNDALSGISDAKYMSDFDFQNVIPMVNDSKELSMDEKKSRLKKLFKLVGISLHFKNGKKQGASK
jgi:hypothetical protein